MKSLLLGLLISSSSFAVGTLCYGTVLNYDLMSSEEAVLFTVEMPGEDMQSFLASKTDMDKTSVMYQTIGGEFVISADFALDNEGYPGIHPYRVNIDTMSYEISPNVNISQSAMCFDIR